MVTGSRFALTNIQRKNSRCALARLSTKFQQAIITSEHVHLVASPLHQRSLPGRESGPRLSCYDSAAIVIAQLMKRLFNKTLLALAVIILVTAFAQAQTTAPINAAAEKTQPPQSTPTNSTYAPAPSATSLSQAAYLTPIAGYQGVLAETVDGGTLAAQAADSKFNPASAVKLATALVALQTFGPDHRFLTCVWASGTIDKLTGTLNGDLVITGRDPSFHYEHGVMLARELNDLGIRSVTGNVIVAPGFTMNFDWSAKRSGEELIATLDSARRPAAATRAWLDERMLINDKASLSTVPSVVIAGEAQVDSAPASAKPLLTHKSSKLVDVLKALLCYSNNFMAERIGETVGGPQGVTNAVIKKLDIPPDEISLASTSGLGVNRVTPRAMMKILRGLRVELAKNKLALFDILPVAGIDPGTLEDRYTDLPHRGSVVAKTGTLIRTDGGASALVGQMKTRSGRIVLFVIMNQSGNVNRFRQNQDFIVSAIQNTLGGPAPFEYRPVQLSLRLAGTDYETAKSRGEVEPKEQ
jgi:serine-type D-Ala-D-Ala carboxypeptidase/endopeptidase (penicillin-binding protein 4)